MPTIRRSPSEEMSEDYHHSPQQSFRIRFVCLAKIFEISCAKQSMECEAAIFCIIKLRDTLGQVYRFAMGSEKMLLAKIFNREPKMVMNLGFEFFTTKT